MNKKIIFFSIDRLGDYLIRSQTIKDISKNYLSSEIICSEKNYKLISKQKFFSNVVLFENRNKNFNKIIFLYKYFLKKYDAVISLDGKSISYFLLILIRSKNKFTVIYRKKGLINYLNFNFVKFIFNLLNIKFSILNSRHIIEKGNHDNYPTKYKFLKNFYKNINDNVYYLEKSDENIFSEFDNKFIVIHLDEKFKDIENIDYNFENSLINFQKIIKKKIFLTSFNNTHKYYENLNIIKKDFKNINKNLLNQNNILVIENIPIMDFQTMLFHSNNNISCHSGYFVHTSLALKKKTIDIINEKDEIWLQSWLLKPENYTIIYKSRKNYSNNINTILNEIKKQYQL